MRDRCQDEFPFARHFLQGRGNVIGVVLHESVESVHDSIHAILVIGTGGGIVRLSAVQGGAELEEFGLALFQ